MENAGREFDVDKVEIGVEATEEKRIVWPNPLGGPEIERKKMVSLGSRRGPRYHDKYRDI